MVEEVAGVLVAVLMYYMLEITPGDLAFIPKSVEIQPEHIERFFD
jgi:hypothetical protein